MQYRFTKIVATLGPATSNKEMIELYAELITK